jgi:hypothetical protein
LFIVVVDFLMAVVARPSLEDRYHVVRITSPSRSEGGRPRGGAGFAAVRLAAAFFASFADVLDVVPAIANRA